MKSSLIRPIHDEIAVVGWACRLPGANSIQDLWSLLIEERCAITQVPDDRFATARFGHPRRQERGKSYSWAAGMLDDIWHFDPSVFGMSPREASQTDPQQRLLLELTWEALEDAGIPPSAIANSEIGVFVGASQTDYSHGFLRDPAIADAHFATGTALSILANRISYIFGLHGPSLAVDTACSSSLVALHQAHQALRSGRIDTAIVAGCNMIVSPASFIAFSQASMLSPTGLCRAFSADADGFVRGEGAVVLILRKMAIARDNPVHGILVATEVNSDGRTNGIALPSLDAQQALLSRIYGRGGIDADRLAFVEAHGTGTPVGDPVEATAIGRMIGQARAHPIPIGSIKTNIGHLEPASGLAGVVKALLALKHGVLPPSLNFDAPNPHVDFAKLNLSVCTQSLLLPHAADQLAGVNSFGFGGTNAHAVLGAGRKSAARPSVATTGREAFTFSANSSGALHALAREHRNRVSQQSDQETVATAAAIVHRRERLPHRLVISSARARDVTEALDAFLVGGDDARLTVGTAVGSDMPVAFVFSGNGGQRVGMGQTAYRNNAAFRSRFEEADAYFKEIGGWSLKEALFSDALTERLPQTSIAQPLIFAIQCASTAALSDAGLMPAVVIGHSVGEVAAAEAAGALDLRSAVKVIHCRSAHQEVCRGAGRMAAVLAPLDLAQALIDEVGGIEIAAINGPRTVTVAGTAPALAAFKDLTRAQGIALLDLGLDYPFHTALMAPIQSPLEAELRDIRPRDGTVPFVSTVTGACLPGSRLNANYWWRNVREPVRFSAAIRAAAELGARYFVELGPRATLLQHVSDTLKGEVTGVATYAPLGRSDDDSDPFASARSHAIVAGAQIATEHVFGPNPGPAVVLPGYPWQGTHYRLKHTVELTDRDWTSRPHAFAGVRSRPDALDWRGQADTVRIPELADHKLGDQTIFPGTALLEIGLAVGREWLGVDQIALARFEILQPLDLSNGETREILTRVSPGSNTLEILSRPRLSDVNWLLHCRCKVQTPDSAAPLQRPDAGPVQDVLEPTAVYAIADASGLHYGPAFRLIERVSVHRDGRIAVELAAADDTTPFTLDPMRLDACSHGIFSLFPELNAVARGVTYIPVRMEEVALLRPYVRPRRALLEIQSKSDRSLVLDIFVYGADDALVAVLRGVRTQAIPMRRVGALESVAYVELPRLIDGTILAETGVSSSTEDILATARQIGLAQEATTGDTEEALLLEGWAFAAAHAIASSLADRGRLDVEALVSAGQLPERLQPWLLSILNRLASATLAVREGAEWRIVADPSLPSARSVVAALVREHPARAAEVLIATALANVAETLPSRGLIELADVAIPKPVLDFYHATSVPLRDASDALDRLLVSHQPMWPTRRALRILQIGFAPLAIRLLSTARAMRLTVLEPDRQRYAAAEASLARMRNVSLIGSNDTTGLGQFDLIIGVSGLHRLPGTLTLADVRRWLAPGGAMIGLEPAPSLFKDLVFGLDPDWFRPGSSDAPASPLRSPAQWRTALLDADFSEAASMSVPCGSGTSTFIVARAPTGAPIQLAESDPTTATKDSGHVMPSLIVVSPVGGELTDAIAQHLGTSEMRPAVVIADAPWPGVEPGAAVFVSGMDDEPSDPVAALTQRCLDIRECATRIGDRNATLWLVFSGALAVGTSRIRPVETGAWAFARTLANELPNLDVRRIDLAPSLSIAAAAAMVHRIVASGTAETELHVDEDAVRAVRVTAVKAAVEQGRGLHQMAAHLERRLGAGPRLAWLPLNRTTPGPDEVEIEVEATGVNFRDVMWSLALLPEDMLEHGFSGPTLGLECAGRVVRAGKNVRDLAVGDRAMAFAASAFSTHVTVAHDQAVPLPTTLSCDAAATIPVAFFTAYYGLVTQARLKRGEWVLIHGGAGAVGMAAVQIARARGAKVIATAGAAAKRELLRTLGVEHVLDSRSTRFVDEVRSITGAGVDVVLNSLAGEAMERSIACLRPFGRFVELGKRDYVTDTHVGLRPFRRNLSYFGVDVDQVIGARKAEGRRIFAKIVSGFAKGTYVPLPYSVVDSENVVGAFHLMQQASHIGKIVVRPPAKGASALLTTPMLVRPDGTHIITGAFGGFGMETAKWLVDKGARHLVLIGRRGAVTHEAARMLGDFAARGVAVLAHPCDVSDPAALERLFDVIHATMPPIAGVIHAAMVLDDGILANLDADRFQRVLAPKIMGAENLDRLVRGANLDYFVLFSSVTTLVGNPGQANYVAANAYMEGVARRRRQAGLPALAIGWGPISDVGVVAQNQRLQAGLQRLTGVSGMRARDALLLMEQALAQPTHLTQLAVMTIAPSDSAFTADRLAVLKSPTYEAYVSEGRAGGGSGDTIDLRAIAARDGVDAARAKAVAVIGGQVAQVLQLSGDDVSPVRPLAEIGLDSLMALELVISLEERFGTRVPLSGASGAMTIAEIADQIIAHIGIERDRAQSMVATMAEQHLARIGQMNTAAAAANHADDEQPRRRGLL